ncbi:MAG: DUF885 domain-containing protein [Candidatus Solibacter sp.]|jgi:hypothetical protein
MHTHNLSPSKYIAGLLLVAVTWTGCSRPARDGGRDWDAYSDRFIKAEFQAFPDMAVYVGRHEFDGKLPDWSEVGLTRTVTWLHSARREAAAFSAASLDQPRSFERDYLLAVIDRQLFWMESADAPHTNPDFYVVNNPTGGPALSPDVYVTRPYAPVEQRLRAYVAWAKAIRVAVAQIQANLHPPLRRPMIDVGRLRFGGLASYLANDIPAAFAEAKDAALQAEFRTANSAAAKAFSDFDTWLESQRKTQTKAFALGADKFSEMLRASERVDVPLDRLEQIGREDMARNLTALREACAAFAPGATLTQCVAREAAHKPGGGAVLAGTEQVSTLEAFVRAHNLVSIPGTERALVHESPPYQWGNGAYIDTPGPFEPTLPAIYYVAPPDPKWTKEEQAAYIPSVANLLFTTVHEVWPGHFLQFEHSNRVPSVVGRIFVGYAFMEGWAHYSEEMMWEAGLGNGDPEIHIGQLMEALKRDARFLSAIGMHTGKMTLAQSETMFREDAFQDAGTARQQAARGTYDPAYLGYTLGKLMIRKLRADWTATRGGQAAWKSFHDGFLSYGGPPIPLVRKAMGVDGPPL